MFSSIQHFKEAGQKWGYAVVDGNVRISIDLSRFAKQFADAQWALGNAVFDSCKPFMPLLTGDLIHRSHVEDNGRKVIFAGPYARFLYMGKVMVGEVSGSPWARFDERKRVTERRLNYTKTFHPDATDHWFDAAKARDGEKWIAEVKKKAGGG